MQRTDLSSGQRQDFPVCMTASQYTSIGQRMSEKIPHETCQGVEMYPVMIISVVLVIMLTCTLIASAASADGSVRWLLCRIRSPFRLGPVRIGTCSYCRFRQHETNGGKVVLILTFVLVFCRTYTNGQTAVVLLTFILVKLTLVRRHVLRTVLLTSLHFINNSLGRH